MSDIVMIDNVGCRCNIQHEEQWPKDRTLGNSIFTEVSRGLPLSNSHELPSTDEIDPLQNWTGQAETVLEPTNKSVMVQRVQRMKMSQMFPIGLCTNFSFVTRSIYYSAVITPTYLIDF